MLPHSLEIVLYQELRPLPQKMVLHLNMLTHTHTPKGVILLINGTLVFSIPIYVLIHPIDPVQVGNALLNPQ